MFQLYFYQLKIMKNAVYNEKLLEQLNSFLKRRINWNKYQSKISTEIKKQYLDYLIDRSF